MAMQIVGRERRKLRIRKRMSGTVEKPRLTVFRSAKHIYAQVIDDVTGKTVAALVAKICLSKKISKVVFDRNGYLYHGRVSALANAAREGGLKF